MGFAIGRRKRIWISLNPAITTAREDFERLTTLLSPDVGYAGYINSKQLSDQFLSTAPWKDLDNDLLGPGFSSQPEKPPFRAILYLRQPYDTEESVKLAESLAASSFSQGLQTDNPRENTAPTLSWYAAKVRDTDAVLVHLLSSDYTGHREHNLRCAFLAGLARGFDRHVLMLAPKPYTSPVDYRDMLRVHETATECTRYALSWIREIEQHLPLQRAVPRSRRDVPLHALDLRNLRIGEYIAELEPDTLPDYFLETQWYSDALRSQHRIFVGRRGIGKTATLFAIERKLRESRENHMCALKPPGYEVDGVIRLLSQNIDRAEKGYLVETLWKFLLYTELANSVVGDYQQRSLHEQVQMNAERLLVEFMQEQPSLFRESFATRLEQVIAPLLTLESDPSAAAQTVKISERLHSSTLAELRILLGKALCSRQNVTILLDNLDEPWRPHHDFRYLSELLSGLLRVSIDIVHGFRRKDSRLFSVNTNIIIFMRSDVFYHLQHDTAEQDKLPVQFVAWTDNEMLMRVVDIRLSSALAWNVEPERIWRELFIKSIVGISPREFIAKWALPRPRDVIKFLQEAIATAVNRGHEIVTETDLYAARQSYSRFAMRAILAEDDPRKGKLEAVLFEFAGVAPELGYSAVKQCILAASVAEQDVEFYIDLLCDLNFLGIAAHGDYVLARDEAERAVLREVAKRVARQRDGAEGEETYQVNYAFHDVLQIR